MNSHTLSPHTARYQAYFAAVVDQLKQGQTVTLAFGGSSMYPTLKPTDKVTFAPLAHSDNPQVGDVVLFSQFGHYIVHRVVSRHNARYKVQGDNNYGTESISRWDIVGILTAVERADGTRIDTSSRQWAALSRRSIVRKRLKNFAIRWLSSQGRRQVRPWYFIGLAFLMWAPLNGVGVRLDNYILGIRADHFLHASVFIPCTLYLMDLMRRRWLVWLVAVVIGLVAEGGQYLLPFRAFDVNDLVANVIGISLGWGAILWAKRNNEKKIINKS